MGVVTDCCDGNGPRRLVLADGSLTRVDPSLTDDDIVALHGLDILRHAPKVPWGVGRCIDGPRRGETSFVVDELGKRVAMRHRVGEVGDVYDVVRTADESGFAALRFVSSELGDLGKDE